jgi:DNA helicase-2/ATP-dependent DNA helicase PcrA
VETYLQTLNDSQRAAVEYIDGPQLVIAGAGSGKTRVLTAKVAYLLQHDYAPQRIMALTFTKKAAGEMRERITQLVGQDLARRLGMGTFHSLFSRILRAEAEAIGFKRDFTIYDQSDSRSLVKSIIKDKGLDEKKYKPVAIQNRISSAKNALITPAIYAKHADWIGMDRDEGLPQFLDIYATYTQRCYRAGAMDFDDLLLYTNILFRDHPDILERYQELFQYVLVDEYQDTNKAQHLIVEQLVRHHRHLCVVGDDAQSIYSFRGANIANILKMQDFIPGTRLFKLERNYRSTQNIVDAANSLIRANTEQIPKTIYSENSRGSLISLKGTFSDLEEATAVVDRLADLHRQGYNYGDSAILYRTNAQSRTLEDELRKRGIDYHIYGGLSFYQRKEIKDIIAYLRLVVNPADEEAFKRIINYPTRGIGATTVAKVAAAVATHNLPFFDICLQPELYDLGVSRATAAKLGAFASFINRYNELSHTVDAYTLTVQLVQESGIKDDIATDSTPEGQSRRENVNELIGAISTFVQTAVSEGRNDEVLITDFLSDVSLSGDLEPATDVEAAPADSVSLMTIHASKGLEVKNIFVVGVEEGLIPSDMCCNQPKGVEEERRLLYVAITRAEENCFLSYATSRFRNGRSEFTRPSRFLKDIDSRYMKRADVVQRPSFTDSYGMPTSPRPAADTRPSGSPTRTSYTATVTTSAPQRKPNSSVLDFTGRVHKMTRPDTIAEAAQLNYHGHPLREGQTIVHSRFGRGKITALFGGEDDGRISVDFEHEGTKTLLLKFSKIEIVEG